MNYREPTAAERREFLRIARALRKLSDAGLSMYLDDETLNLMAGPAHDERGRPRPDNIRESLSIPRLGGGAF